MLNVGVIGIGNCGNQIACKYREDTSADIFLINSSETDLASVPDNIPKAVIGTAEGSGKNRTAAKEMLKDSIMELMHVEEFVRFMSTKEIVIIAGSTGGGTGSGIALLMAKILRSSFKRPDGKEDLLVVTTGVFPALPEGYSTQVNTLWYMHELHKVLGDGRYMLYDNGAFPGVPSYRALEMVNSEVVEAFKVLQLKYNNITQYDSIDEEDMRVLLRYPGRMAIVTLLNIKEKDVDEVGIEDMIIEKLKKSANVELQRDGIVGGTGLIVNLSQTLAAKFDTNIPKVREFIGEPSDALLHVSINEEKTMPNNVIFIATGLSKVSDRIAKIEERVDELDKRPTKNDQEEAMISEEEIKRLNSRRAGIPNTGNTVPASGEVSLSGIFGEFGV